MKSPKCRSRRNSLVGTAVSALLNTSSTHPTFVGSFGTHSVAVAIATTITIADAAAAVPMQSSSRRWDEQRRRSFRGDFDPQNQHDQKIRRELQRQRPTSSPTSLPTPEYRPPLFGAGKSADWGVSSSSSDGYEVAPVRIDIDFDDPSVVVTRVAAGDLHSVFLTSDGRAWTAGTVTDEERGLGRDISSDGGSDNDHGFAPVTEVYYQYASKPSPGPEFVSAHASQFFTVLLDANGRAWATGANYDGRLCLGDFNNRDRFVQIPDLGGAITAVAVGDRHTLLLRQDGVVLACGWNQFGQLGINVAGEDVATPTEVIITATGGDGGEDGDGQEEAIVAIAAGRGTSYFHTTNGSILATGTNHDGQLCVRDRINRVIPAMVGLYGNSVRSIAAGKSSLYLLRDNGSVLACGDNSRGQLGDGTFDSSDSPVQVLGLGPATGPDAPLIAGVHSGPTASNAFFVSANGEVYGTGANGSGQLGLGNFVDRNVPTLVACSAFGESSSNGDVSSGNDHALFLGEDASYCVAPPTASPLPSFSPSQSASPSASASPSVIPTETLVPTRSSSPTYPPTVSAAPTLVRDPELTSEPEFPPLEPTLEPTLQPTLEPTSEPTLDPTKDPTVEPAVTSIPTYSPTEAPPSPPLPAPPSSARRRSGFLGFESGTTASLAVATMALVPWVLMTW